MQDSMVYYIISAVISIIILYYLVKFATKSEEISTNSAIQVKLLEMIAVKNGATKQEIDEVFKTVIKSKEL